MASYKGQRSQGNQGKYMKVDGGSFVDVDRFSGSTIVVGDTADVLIPAGALITGIEWQVNATNSQFNIGYRAKDPASTLLPSTNYFNAGGQLSNASSGIRSVCSFIPIKFEEDVYIQFAIISGGGSFQTLDVITSYNCVGPS